MLVCPYRFERVAGCAVLALLAVSASAALAQPSLTNARGLDFGRFVSGSGGTVIVSPAGLRSRSGAVVLLTSPGAGQAIFNVNRISGIGSGTDTATAVSISLPVNGSVWLTGSGGGAMAVNNFVSTPAATGSIQAPRTLAVGATLSVAPNQAPGTYSGTFSVIVDYQ
jgi:hypothetical protein